MVMIKRYYFISGFEQKEVGEASNPYFNSILTYKSWFVNSKDAFKKITDFIKCHPTYSDRELIITSFNRV